MFFKLYLTALPVFVIIDSLWLGLIAKNFYAQHIGQLLRSPINWWSALIFYLVFLVGLVIFVITPAVTKGSWLTALALGALFGFITYATYDLTNLATLKDWPLVVTIVDLIWGAFIGAAVSVITYFIVTKLF